MNPGVKPGFWRYKMLATIGSSTDATPNRNSPGISSARMKLKTTTKFDCHTIPKATSAQLAAPYAVNEGGGAPIQAAGALTYLAASISQARPSMILVPLTRLLIPTDSLVPWVNVIMGSSSGWEPENP